ncbi:hypothetical protein P261_00139 [Lachnospiraceae bacterium TWA4]|nr:hypothetical protein P261_00139 [Lachnospiraceae bacterium TWA4]
MTKHEEFVEELSLIVKNYKKAEVNKKSKKNSSLNRVKTSRSDQEFVEDLEEEFNKLFGLFEDDE